MAYDYIDPKDFNFVSQMAHFFTLAFLNVVWAYFWYITRHPLVAIAGTVPSLAYGILHEFWWDPTHENAATRGSDWEDFGFLMSGMAAGQVMGLVMAITKVMERG
jgi:hypothetical protein